jgi:hypothetical protein
MREQQPRNIGSSTIREPAVTNATTTVVVGKSLRRSILVAVIALLAACGGGKHGDTYSRANDVQGTCCQKLGGGARDKCLSEIVRIDDAAIAKSSANQATYACVAKHFVCDPSTGHPTQPSAQAQLECIQDLGQ